MMENQIHEFKNILSDVNVGDIVIVHWAQRFQRGIWDIWVEYNYQVFKIENNIVYMHMVKHEHTHFYVDSKNFYRPNFKFSLPEKKHLINN